MNLLSYLPTERKSLAVQIITVVILLAGAYMGSFGETFNAWLGIIAMGGTLALSTFFPSGTFVQGWTTVMWVTNIVGIVMQLFTAMGDAGLVDAMTINKIMIGVNVVLQVFFKDFTLNPSRMASDNG